MRALLVSFALIAAILTAPFVAAQKVDLTVDVSKAGASAMMDRYDPQKKVALVVDEWGAWYAPLPGTNPGFLVQQNSLRDAMLAALKPKPISAKVQGGKLALKLEPKSVTVISIEQ